MRKRRPKHEAAYDWNPVAVGEVGLRPRECAFEACRQSACLATTQGGAKTTARNDRAHAPPSNIRNKSEIHKYACAFRPSPSVDGRTIENHRAQAKRTRPAPAIVSLTAPAAPTSMFDACECPRPCRPDLRISIYVPYGWGPHFGQPRRRLTESHLCNIEVGGEGVANVRAA